MKKKILSIILSCIVLAAPLTVGAIGSLNDTLPNLERSGQEAYGENPEASLDVIVGGYAITRLVVGTIGGGGAVQEGCDRFHVDEQACNDQDLCAYNTIKTRCEVKVDAGVPSGDSCDQLEDEQTCENQEGCVFIFGTCTSSEF